MTKGNFILSRLKNMKKTQTWLAMQMGTTRAAVNNWVRGESFVKTGQISKLCKVLEITPEELFKHE